MRIRIEHATTYAYDRPARFIIQTLRLTPRSSEAQQVLNWTIETDVDARLRQGDDAFGNITHTLYTEAPTDGLTLRVSGDVVTTDTSGVSPVVQERLSPLAYLRDTPLTARTRLIGDYARDTAGEGDTLSRLHRVMNAIHRDIAFQVGATSTTHGAADVLELGRGVCQDHAHLFIASARALAIPARYVSGHLVIEGRIEQDAAHAWAEAHVEGLGWVGFDAANGVCPTDAYVRVAAGPDYLAAAPVRGASYGGGSERMDVRLNVRDTAMQQDQQQA